MPQRDESKTFVNFVHDDIENRPLFFFAAFIFALSVVS